MKSRAPAWRFVIRLSVCSVVLAAGTSIGLLPAAAQPNARAKIFQEADTAYIRAKACDADVISPTNFERAMDAYLAAKDYFQRGLPVDEIRGKVHLAAAFFAAATDASKPARGAFAATLAARSDAMTADAIRSSPDLWNRAEALLRSAAQALEKGDQSSAQSDAGEAQGVYRMAELEAIKTNYLAPARDLLARADGMDVKSTAPQTLERARKLLTLAESVIKQNRYNNAEARRLAEEASYEAAHAIYLHQIISQMVSQNRDLEDALLMSEESIAKIGAALNLQLRFDTGFDPAAQATIAAMKSRDSIRLQIADSLRRLQIENEDLRTHLAVLENNSGAAANAEAEQLRKIEGRKKYNQTVALASVMFSQDDGAVLRDGNRVIIRIYGLEFSPSTSAIEPQYSGLLSKVARTIQMFPNCQLTVEGHTEDGGSETTNQRISEARAEAVAAYLRTVVSRSTAIVSQGYGSNRPIADNATADGRAHNRRIDIIVIPEWAIVGR